MIRTTKAPLLIATRLRLSGPRIEQRIRNLHRCLRFSCFLLNTATHTPFDPTIKTSIAALGELLSTGFATAATLKRIPDAQVTFSFAWADRFLDDGCDLEQQMLAHGWCPSEVAKIRAVHQGLGTRHYLSLMRKGGPPQRSIGRWQDTQAQPKEPQLEAFQLEGAQLGETDLEYCS